VHSEALVATNCGIEDWIERLREGAEAEFAEIPKRGRRTASIPIGKKMDLIRMNLNEILKKFCF
jgi:hypothetical protein